MYAPTDDLLVFVEGPRWQTVGYDNVKRGWTDFINSPISLNGCAWVEHLYSKISADMGFVAGISELDLDIGGKRQTIRFRGTFVFQKNSEGEWKVVFEHFSQPAPDPYGIGDWLRPV